MMCRACHSDKLYSVISRKDFILLFCLKCTLLQQKDIIPANKEAIGLKNVVDRVLSKVTLRMEDVVVDILSQDGTLLKYYPKDLIRVGFDPLYQGKYQGVNMLLVNRWFTHKTYKAVFQLLPPHKDKLPKIISAVNVINNISNPYSLIQSISQTLHPSGVFVIRDNYLGNIIGQHNIPLQNSYFSLYALERLLHHFGLEVFDIEDDFKVFIRHMMPLRQLRVKEREVGLNNRLTYTLWDMKLKSQS